MYFQACKYPYFSKVNRHVLVFFNVTFLWLFFAFKYHVGTDSVNYLRIYDNTKYAFEMYGEYWLPEQELLYYSLNLFSAINGFGTVFIYTVCGFLIAFFTFRAPKILDVNPFGFLLLVFPFHILMMAISGIRQGVAESIIYFGFSLLYLGKKRLFLLYVLISSGFHSSAIFFLPLYFVNIKKRYLSILFLLVLPLLVVGGESEYGNYLDSGLYNQGIILRLGFLAACTLALIFEFRENSSSLTTNQKNLVLFSIFSLPMLIVIGIVQTTIADRLSYYFIGISILLYLRLRCGQHVRGLVFIGLTLLGFLALILFLIVGNNGADYYYDSYLFHLFSGESILI